MLDEIKEYKDKKISEINKHKWIASEKAGIDLGKKAIEEWQKDHEIHFKRHWLNERFELK
ncbi:MAG: hypothetical protein JNL74_01595 [Fibrobacteres bacterium]|nr:hypothetical protein [Fibrobacterota bacterium]